MQQLAPPLAPSASVCPPLQVVKAAPGAQHQQAAAEAAALQAMQALTVTVGPLDSRQGGLHDVGGSQVRALWRGQALGAGSSEGQGEMWLHCCSSQPCFPAASPSYLQRTQSCAGGKRKVAAAREDSEVPAQHFPDTQQASMAAAGPGARIKASMVEVRRRLGGCRMQGAGEVSRQRRLRAAPPSCPLHLPPLRWYTPLLHRPSFTAPPPLPQEPIDQTAKRQRRGAAKKEAAALAPAAGTRRRTRGGK